MRPYSLFCPPPRCWCRGNAWQDQLLYCFFAEEAKFLASRTELFKCPSCDEITRFARFNDVQKLLETRVGYVEQYCLEQRCWH